MTRALPYYFQIIENSNGTSPALTRVSPSNFFVTKLLEIRTLILNFISNFLEIRTFIVSIIKRLILNEPMVQPFYWVLDLKKKIACCFFSLSYTKWPLMGLQDLLSACSLEWYFIFNAFIFPLFLKLGDLMHHSQVLVFLCVCYMGGQSVILIVYKIFIYQHYLTFYWFGLLAPMVIPGSLYSLSWTP